MYLTNVRAVDKLRIESMITVSKKLKIIIFLGDEQPYFTGNVGMFVKMKTAGKRFYEENSIVERYQRQSVEFSQAIGMELINDKNFKDVADRFDTSPTTVMRRFDQVSASMLRETNKLPEVIAIDEYKGDAGGEKYQTVIADPVERKPLEILKTAKKKH